MITDIEQLAKKLCVGKFSNLHLSYNDHKSSYETVANALSWRVDWYEPENFVSPEEMRRAIDTDTLWTLQWYPDTPGAFHVLHASSLEVLLKAAAERIDE